MPTITVNQDDFYHRIGKTYTEEELDELLFQCGLELDEGADPALPRAEQTLKIEVPANRYDLLAVEGLARWLHVFINDHATTPEISYATVDRPKKVYVREGTEKVRPFVTGAILRNVSFNELRYDSFIEIQEKLHQNLARRRQLVAMGTHDLDKVAPGDIEYKALPPTDIRFTPLNKTQEMNAAEMMDFYDKNDKHISKYLHIIRDSPVYPVFTSSTGQVLSMPPIINSDATKISKDTRNIFIDMTGTDLAKLETACAIIVALFSEYCDKPFTVEPVEIIYPPSSPLGARQVLAPPLAPRFFVARLSEINGVIGVTLDKAQVPGLLARTGLEGSLTPYADAKTINDGVVTATAPNDTLIYVRVPAYRSDILHEQDIVEEVAIGYGFDNLVKTFPSTNTIAIPYPINKLSDIVRRAIAEAGWLEVLPLTLCSHNENFAFLNRTDSGNDAVVLENPKTQEYQIVRTSLLPGLLKTIRENRKHPLPLRIFEVADVVLKDPAAERKASNHRRVGAVFSARRAEFEVIQGLLNRILQVLSIPHSDTPKPSTYRVEPCDSPTYFPGRGANIVYTNASGSSSSIGAIGILHPDVLSAFEIDYPCSVLEFDLAPFL